MSGGASWCKCTPTCARRAAAARRTPTTIATTHTKRTQPHDASREEWESGRHFTIPLDEVKDLVTESTTGRRSERQTLQARQQAQQRAVASAAEAGPSDESPARRAVRHRGGSRPVSTRLRTRPSSDKYRSRRTCMCSCLCR